MYLPIHYFKWGLKGEWYTTLALKDSLILKRKVGRNDNTKWNSRVRCLGKLGRKMTFYRGRQCKCFRGKVLLGLKGFVQVGPMKKRPFVIKWLAEEWYDQFRRRGEGM